MPADKLTPEMHEALVSAAQRGRQTLPTIAEAAGLEPRTLRRWFNEYAKNEDADPKYAQLKLEVLQAITGYTATLEEELYRAAKGNPHMLLRLMAARLPEDYDPAMVRQRARQTTPVVSGDGNIVVVLQTGQTDPKKLFGREEA